MAPTSGSAETAFYRGLLSAKSMMRDIAQPRTPQKLHKLFTVPMMWSADCCVRLGN